MLNPLKFINKLFKSPNEKDLERLNQIVRKINAVEEDIKKLTSEQFPVKTLEFKERIKKGENLDIILPEAFALVREAGLRTLGERPFDCQLMGSIVLHEGKIAEMSTGEGKTLSSVSPSYLNALSENGVHIVTVNEYLAVRDSQWMGKIYNYLGLQVGCIKSEMDTIERKKNYNYDITYGTNSEFGFDYLRDNMTYSLNEMVQRNHNFCIVDEVDSVLIDEARTPLIISGPSENQPEQYIAVDKLIKGLNSSDYDVDEKDRNVILTNKGIDNIESIFSKANILKNNNFYDPANLNLVHHVNQALRANHLFLSGKDYMVKDNSIQIIDEFTGRVLEGRRYGDGLHQALEAKEKVDIQSENQTLATITYQNYFRNYSTLSGMTGTAKTEAEEFFDIYGLNVVSIPTNKKMIRKDWNDKIFRTEKEKNEAIINKVIECNKIGQPVLMGTSSINKSEVFSKLLKEKGIKHSVLNAKHHEQEAKIIEDAGKMNSITCATSMAGRGTDIKLGGKKSGEKNNEEKNKIKELGGLYVIGTERMESRRVDNQFRGRSGRQGDEGNSVFYVSLEDDLMRIFGSDSMNNILKKLGLKEGESIDHPWINKALERAQAKVEARNFDIRKALLKFDNINNDQRKIIFSQRKNILKNDTTDSLINDLLNEIIDSLLTENNRPVKQINNKNNILKIKSLLGKSINEEDLDKLLKLDSQNIKKNIIEIYYNKKHEREKILGKEQNIEIEKRIFIQTIDTNWRSHLQYLEQLRQVIGLRSYGQKDPLVEYGKETFKLFEDLLEKIKFELLTILFSLTIVEKPIEDVKESIVKNNIANNPDCLLLINKNQKISRNEKCPATGKKFKQCCGAL